LAATAAGRVGDPGFEVSSRLRRAHCRQCRLV